MTARSVPEWVGKTPDAAIPPRVLFARLIEKTVRDGVTTCWLWTGASTAKGYGHMWDGARYEKAHRLAFLLTKGPIPPGGVICHRCDVPSCINPDHLWLGTAQDNIDDARAKGRFRNGASSGEANGSAKLSNADVLAIRSAPRGYGTGLALAARFGVRESTISAIRRGHARTKQ